ncbi:unnamed protein product [Ilex paraguariensis]|uniref:Pentatricopeptide repeat-containing protein n=1 Tax=Ilex paraguariensis TaxID=185542 RepID=A0ABC8UH73_9AQUA
MALVAMPWDLEPHIPSYASPPRGERERKQRREERRLVEAQFGKGKRLKLVLGRSRISPNVYALNMVASAYCKLGKLQKAVEVFRVMEILDFCPTVASCNILAKKLSIEMKGMDVVPNAYPDQLA